MSGTRKAILKFELESFYKSFDFSILDDLLVEVFDYEYFMKADDNVLIAGGMVSRSFLIILNVK